MKKFMFNIRQSLTVLLGCLSLLGGQAAAAQALDAATGADSASAHAARMHMDIHNTGKGEALHILVGHSLVLQSGSSMRRVFIGNPAVLESFTSSPNEVVLTAKAEGLSSLVLWDESGKSCLYTVHADVDPEALQQALHDAYPNAPIHVVTQEGRVFLTGSVATQEAYDAAGKLAATYDKDVMNSLVIVPVHGKQVQLKLRILEVDRTKAEQQGFNIFTGGRTAFGSSTGQYGSGGSLLSEGGGATGTSASISNPFNLFLFNSKLNVGVSIEDLESKQILQVLSEPTLTTLSGEAAQFLSGGEFPVPVAQSGAGVGGTPTITIQFRPYGVKVAFTPTVNADGTIRLKLAPEVSTLDFSNAVTISGFTIPALATRRTETEVEVRSGQTFAVSGLLDHRTTDNLSHIPGIANIPILGQLFRSKNNTHSVVELVIVVTASVVDPLTDTSEPLQPKLVVPNMSSDGFDKQVDKKQANN